MKAAGLLGILFTALGIISGSINFFTTVSGGEVSTIDSIRMPVFLIGGIALLELTSISNRLDKLETKKIESK